MSMNVSADSFVPPQPSQIDLENGSKVFYMTPLRYDGDEYLPSGLYYNTSPPEPIYLISSYHTADDISYFDRYNVFLSNDGIYFVHFPIPFYREIETSAPIETVLEFYENGNLIKQYNASQLVENKKKIGYTVSMVMWEKDWGSQHRFDAENNTLSVTTIDDITYTFDITTGDIIAKEESHIYTRILIISAAAICVLILGISVFFIIKQYRKC